MPKELIIQAAALRQTQDYMGALNLIEANIASFDGIDRVQGRLQGFYAAKEGGLLDKARALALQISEEDPTIPSVKAFLSDESGWTV
ncbi:MAG TPA: hypothetical protein VGN04_12450 [Herbaspirillum sp.]